MVRCSHYQVIISLVYSSSFAITQRKWCQCTTFSWLKRTTTESTASPGSEYVCVHKGGEKKSLSQLYDGSYKVVQLSDAVVTIQLGNKAE